LDVSSSSLWASESIGISSRLLGSSRQDLGRVMRFVAAAGGKSRLRER
ncbi:unnamed protein product, partial [Urochloa humidicola]